ncbi:hypothetical protein CPB83DRAFT_854969 [Crepidotus variabilis]|uniref:Uncharacterized protein n=1 Tax=Crepidotus variabilis TaxID=179855 RepID=A0A9P6EFK2_9AGAR|nr:hypothetical protein CPB83DRAFT_854969 [Crepidotus variabilis]
MMHQLKCLDLLREEVVRDRPTVSHEFKSTVQIAPVTRHCLNYIRQMIICRGDWELESFQFASHKNPIEWRGQYQCKDWERLWHFVKKNQEEYEGWLETEGAEEKT